MGLAGPAATPLDKGLHASQARSGRSQPHRSCNALGVFGSPDDLKLRSCATLFAAVSPPGSVFERLLDKYFQGERDDRTLRLLGG